MRDSELLIYGLLFLGVVGFNVLKQMLAARAEQRQRQQRQAAAQATGQGMEQATAESDPFGLSETDWGRPPESASKAELPQQMQPVPKPEPSRPAAQARLRPAQVSAKPRHRMFHSRRKVREGIVLMTVLGPCRALQPYDEGQQR